MQQNPAVYAIDNKGGLCYLSYHEAEKSHTHT